MDSQLHQILTKCRPQAAFFSGEYTAALGLPYVFIRLQKFKLDLEHKPGTQAGNADILSRKPFFNTPKVNEAKYFVNKVYFMKIKTLPKKIRFSQRSVLHRFVIIAPICNTCPDLE